MSVAMMKRTIAVLVATPLAAGGLTLAVAAPAQAASKDTSALGLAHISKDDGWRTTKDDGWRTTEDDGWRTT